MATDQSATVKVAIPANGARAVYHIKPHDSVDLSKIDMKNTRIDLLGADLVLTNTQTKGTIVLAQMALYLFSEEDAPTILGPGGEEISAQTMLSHVGKVWEFTAQDYLGVTSLEKSNPDGNAAAGEGDKSLQDKVGDADAEIAAATAKPMVGQFSSPTEPKPLNENNKTSDALELPPVTTTGAFSIPPRVSVDTPEPPKVDDAGTNNGLTFTFDARLLQPGLTQTVISPSENEIRGGGAFETGAFDDRNTAQFSQEIIDVSAGSKSSYTIYSDNPTYFTDTTSTRMLELTPYLPDGFNPSQILVSGLPAGFALVGATSTADGWLLLNPALNSNGLILLPLTYETGSAANFTLNINFTATFDASTGASTPATGEISYTITRDVDVKPVASAADGNYIDGQGNLVWVMAQNENSTKILAGDKTVTVYGGKGVDEVSSGAGNDIIYGGKGDDIISSGGGNDFLQGGAGDDQLLGGSGNDTADYTDKTTAVSIDLNNLSNNHATAYVNGVAEDTLEDIENINGGTGNDILLGNALANVFNGGDGDDLLRGLGGNDTLSGGNGIDTVSYSYASNGVTVVLNAGAATVSVTGTDVDTLSGIENIDGTAYADNLTGDATTNVLWGGSGNDTFNLSGGSDVIDGDAGTDTLRLASATAGATLNLGSLNGSGYATLTTGATTQTVKSIENVEGSGFADTLTGDATANVLSGMAGNDTLSGGDGDDTIYGGVGSDTLTGGNGTDSVRFDDLAAAVTASLSGAGVGTATSGSDTDTFTGFETIYLTNYNDSLTESVAADSVYGLNGNDTFTMVASDSANDMFDGGTGTDTINYANSSQAIDANLAIGTVTGNGTDTVVSIENVIGTAFNDTIQGSTVNNTLDGGGGVNTLSYAYTSTAVVANLTNVSGGYATITSGSDTDLVRNFQIITGGSGADIFTGDGSGQIFNGETGNDTFNGSLGADTFNGGTNTDTVSYASLSNAITATLDASGNASVTFNGLAKTDTLTGIENITGTTGNDTITGNTSINVLNGGAGTDTLYGMGGNDQLNGDAGNDTIYGGDGNDSITGGDGNDTLYGDTGNDTFNGDAGDDVIDGGAGSNTINYSAQTGNLVIDLSSTNGSATGGTIGNDTLINIQNVVGGGGVDRFTGTAGNDTFTDSRGFNVVTATNGNDTYTMTGTIDYRPLGAGLIVRLDTNTIEKDVGSNGSIDSTDTYTGSDVEGSNVADIMYGRNGTNTLHGNTGNDTIYASLGSDTLTGDTGTDSLYYTSISGSISANLTLQSVSKSIDSSSDTIRTFERLYAGGSDDLFVTNGTAFSSWSTIDGGNGRDTITATGAIGTNVEALNFANIFDNMEVLDLRSATLSGSDSFNLTAADVVGMNGTNKVLDVYVSNGFNLAVSAGSGYSIATDTTSGNTRTVTFTGTNNATLNILSYA